MGKNEVVRSKMARMGPGTTVQAADFRAGRQNAAPQHDHGGVQPATPGSGWDPDYAHSASTGPETPASANSTGNNGPAGSPSGGDLGNHRGWAEEPAPATATEAAKAQTKAEGAPQARSGDGGREGWRQHSSHTSVGHRDIQRGRRDKAVPAEPATGRTGGSLSVSPAQGRTEHKQKKRSRRRKRKK